MPDLKGDWTFFTSAVEAAPHLCLQLAPDLGRGQHLYQAGRQLDRQRHPLHQAADVDHVRNIVVRQGKARSHPARAGYEKLDGVNGKSPAEWFYVWADIGTPVLIRGSYDFDNAG